jgi:hypothetical protein
MSMSRGGPQAGLLMARLSSSFKLTSSFNLTSLPIAALFDSSF